MTFYYRKKINFLLKKTNKLSIHQLKKGCIFHFVFTSFHERKWRIKKRKGKIH